MQHDVLPPEPLRGSHPELGLPAGDFAIALRRRNELNHASRMPGRADHDGRLSVATRCGKCFRTGSAAPLARRRRLEIRLIQHHNKLS